MSDNNIEVDNKLFLVVFDAEDDSVIGEKGALVPAENKEQAIDRFMLSLHLRDDHFEALVLDGVKAMEINPQEITLINSGGIWQA